MAPSIERLTAGDLDLEAHASAKRRRLDNSWESGSVQSTALTVQDDARSVPVETAQKEAPLNIGAAAHPLGIKPLGNALENEVNIKALAGGFAKLPDELLVTVLEYFEARELMSLGTTCRALYAYSRLDELWKSLYVQGETHDHAIVPVWHGDWRSTFLRRPSHLKTAISCRGLYSDVLHRPWQCAHLSVIPYARNIPSQNAIARFSDLSHSEFLEHAGNPFILTEPSKAWKIFRTWSIDVLREHYANTIFRAEAVDWPLQTYLDYMGNNHDESPLYMFDHEFAEKMDLDLEDPTASEPAYTTPEAFGPNLFDVLEENRPNRRWLIVGPERSGSTFHADPNGTSAWNAVVRGSKYWLMFPPPADGSTPEIPGVHVSADLSEVTAPLSLSEYLLTFHEYARRTPGCIEAVCCEGEVLYVPAGWYHMVVNLEKGIAVTQNFVSEASLVGVLRFLRDRPDQATGFKRTRDSDHEAGDGTEYELFSTGLQEKHPDILEKALRELAEQDEKKTRKSKWDLVTGSGPEASTAEQAGGFSFGFGGNLEEDE